MLGKYCTSCCENISVRCERIPSFSLSKGPFDGCDLLDQKPHGQHATLNKVKDTMQTCCGDFCHFSKVLYVLPLTEK